MKQQVSILDNVVYENKTLLIKEVHSNNQSNLNTCN